MPITGTDHMVLLVKDIEAGINTWQEQLGVQLSHRSADPGAGIQQAFFALADSTFIELIAPLGETSVLHEALASRGEGVHVLALRVDDLEASVAALEAKDVQLIGAGTMQVFIHPRSANGVMIQLWPNDRPHRWRDNLDPSDPLNGN